jgi:DNA processing protein
MSEYQDEALALLTLSLCRGVSNGAIYALCERFGSARATLKKGVDALLQVEGVGGATASAICAGPGSGAVERELDLMERHRVRLVTRESDDYPPPLTYLDRAAPVLLRMAGGYAPRDQMAVALVGSRRCSSYGRRQAARIACDLASMGFAVVSGMADGIDSEAHRGAILGKGRTLAVLGQGLGHRMPEDRMDLAAQIVEHGALLSELPMSAPPRPGNFPPRNRLVSGLCLGVVVVEAAARSGSLITARLAGEQGRAVFAVPGNVDRPTSRGCHRLIRDGAILVENARDVVEALGPLSEPIAMPAAADDEPPGEPVSDPRVLALNEREKLIYQLLDSSPLHIDEVVAQTELPASIVSSTLLTLEIRGLISQVAGNRYHRAGAAAGLP